METTYGEYIVFESKGEPMKDLMGTAVVAALSAAYPDKKIVVTTLNPELWLHNPRVYRVYDLKFLQYFFDDFIENKNSMLFKHDPYVHTDFITKKAHLIDVWCKQCGITRGGAMPELYFTGREREVAEKFISMRNSKPSFVIQTHGMEDSMPYPTSFSRDMHMQTAQDVVLAMQKKGFVVLQLKAPSQQTFSGAIPVELGTRETLALLPLTDKRLFNDSTAHHGAAATNAPSVITWNSLTPQLHGYNMHTNIFPIADTDYEEIKHSFIEEFRVKRFLPKTKPTYTKPLHRTTDILEALGVHNI